MKTKQTFNPEQEATLTYQPDFQDRPLVITGIGESLLPIVEAVERDYAAQVDKVSAGAIKATQSAPETATEPIELTGHRATIAAKLYDLAHGRNMYDLLKQKREDERDLAMAHKLGLITTDRCAKHERQLAQVRGLN
jgi:hypothetical protein